MYSHEHWWRGKQQNGGSNAQQSSPVGVRLLQLRVAGESHTPCYWEDKGNKCDEVRKKSCYSPAKKLLASLGSLLIADNLQKQPDDDLSAL